MLNELLIIERGVRAAGIGMTLRPSDLKDVGGKLTLIVQLNEDGHVARVHPVPRGVKPWTFRDGQHNSFPFVQPKSALWALPQGERHREDILGKKKEDQRKELLSWSGQAHVDDKAFAGWPSKTLIERLRQRNEQLIALKNTDAAVVPATIERFLRACDLTENGNPPLLDEVSAALIEGLKHTSQTDFVDTAVALLLGKKDKGTWKCGGALLFDAAGFRLSIVDSRLISNIYEAVDARGTIQTDSAQSGLCGLTGAQCVLLSGNSPQPSLPILGQTYLFSKNAEIPASGRYGRSSTEAMPVGQETVNRLEAAIRSLTAEERRNKTWRGIPSESSKESDLLLAFAEEAVDARVTEVLAEEDYSQEETDSSTQAADSVAAYEARASRVIEAVRGKVKGDFSQTPVRVMVLRKLDPANRKVIYAGSPTVGELERAAKAWAQGERSVPQWLHLPVPTKDNRLRDMAPPHVAPLSLVSFTKQQYMRGGTEKQDVAGLPASETLFLFLDSCEHDACTARRRAERVLHMVLRRRISLLAGVAHVQHMPGSWERLSDVRKKRDRGEALRAVTVFGVLLHKLGRGKEVYMNEVAFKLGQLLAAADVVHAGYCADVRGGAVPPSLLGNQVFTMAQTAPAKALATFCRRWKPYDGWAKKAMREPVRADALIASKDKREQQRGWDIKKGLRHAREMATLAAELAPMLNACRADDAFRAELLLGYVAGLPKAQKDD